MCGKRFARKEHVENHIKLVHEKRKPFECGVCKKKFSQKHHFLSHVANMHGVKNSPSLIPTERDLKLTVQPIDKSDYDGGENKTDSRIKLDMKAKHLEIKANHGCKNSESEDSKLDDLKQYLINEVDNSGITIVQEEIDTENSKSQHSTISTMKFNPHVCPFCDQSFKQLPHLGAHIMAVHEPPTGSNPSPNVKSKNKLSPDTTTLYTEQRSNTNKNRVSERSRKKKS